MNYHMLQAIVENVVHYVQFLEQHDGCHFKPQL